MDVGGGGADRRQKGEVVVIVDKDGQTDLAVIISMAAYGRRKAPTAPPAH